MSLEKGGTMPNMTGHFTGRSTMQTVFSLHDTTDHELSIMEVRGVHTTSDENWNGVKMTYWGTADVIEGCGPERGYYVEDHANGDRDYGMFEGTLSNATGQAIIEGTYKYTNGTGKFAGISGGGKFKGRLISPTEIEMSWEGSYQLAAGTRAA
jgi:hypothetical protein